MSQTTLQQALGSIESLPTKKAPDVPLHDLIRPWLAITDLGIREALHITAEHLHRDLCAVHNGLASYLKVMGTTPDPDELQEAACRLIGQMEVLGDGFVDGDISMQSKVPLKFEGGTWVYWSDPKMRMRQTKATFREALVEVREMLAPEAD